MKSEDELDCDSQVWVYEICVYLVVNRVCDGHIPRRLMLKYLVNFVICNVCSKVHTSDIETGLTCCQYLQFLLDIIELGN